MIYTVVIRPAVKLDLLEAVNYYKNISPQLAYRESISIKRLRMNKPAEKLVKN
jgi:hypothetical protein